MTVGKVTVTRPSSCPLQGGSGGRRGLLSLLGWAGLQMCEICLCHLSLEGSETSGIFLTRSSPFCKMRIKRLTQEPCQENGVS